jgi:hypothetical protein
VKPLMKIHQLPMGARFEYEGQEYVKSGPMSGASASGQKLIPKYAVLKPLEKLDAPPAPQSETVLRADVVKAFDAFHAQCKALLPVDRLMVLETARVEFLSALDS